MNERDKKVLARLMAHDPAYVDQGKLDHVARERAIAAGKAVPLTGLDRDIAEADSWRAEHKRDQEQER